MQQGLAVFDDIRDLLQRQFDRLSEIEQEMILVSDKPEPNSAELNRDITTTSPAQTPNSIQSLLRRSLIERRVSGSFSSRWCWSM